MSTPETQYFALLQAALWDKPVATDEPFDWEAVLKIANHHDMGALIGGTASQLAGDARPPQPVLAKMQSAMRGNLVHHMRLKQILLAAVKLLREHGIEPVLLKGFGLALLYPNPNLRQFGDIDLFVGVDRFHEACALLRTLPGGYNWGEEVDVGRHYNIEFGGYPMEIHRVSADVAEGKERERYSAIESDGLLQHPRQVDFEGFALTVPSNEFQVFFTFFHAWHHFLTTGVGWRQVTDVAMTLHAYHGLLDTDKLRQWLEDMHLMQPWQTFGYLMVERLGLPEAEMPFYDGRCRRRAQRLYRRIMATGNFGRKSSFKRSKPRKAGVMRKLHSAVGIFVDFAYRARVFPEAAFREMGAALKNSFGKFGKN